ncbi:sulfite exporter TauE/SafE family protein [Brevibacillus humidisoli]|uniref:sulfite exporter TauE/SafE family protein n=1 Tax=Brevibacillus humidisoli TaxID=2895522 RepID=UPI001E55EFF1|nr:sulfite exporter TauE/SafE family protein [Brevibacillus humidisoli]UFJ39712.1 sulfite exporter TauE/SafE family protein [Brevibacillus humidisoli]
MLVLVILFILVGLLAGAIGSLVGIGGGLFFVPALLYFVNLYEPGSMTPQAASATSLFVIVITALSSTLAYLKQKKVDKASALLFFAASAPGAVAGVYVNKLLQADSFYLLFGLFQLSMFVLINVKDKLKPRSIGWNVKRTFVDADGVEYEYGYKRWVALLVSFFVGIISSLFGVGGGLLMVPVMIVLFRFPPHVATATSMFVIFLSAVVGSMTNLVYGHIDWLYVLLLAPGAWAGGHLGALVAKRLKGKTLVLILRLLILGVALHMVAKSFLA